MTIAVFLSSFDLIVLNIPCRTMAYVALVHTNIKFFWLKFLYSL
jgi:hypothetical protein